MKIRNKKGFTLIELLVVVLIIGILAAVALPQYQKAVWKAQAVEILNIINTTQKALQAYVLEHGNEEKHFFRSGGFGNTDHLSDLDIEIPLTDKLKQMSWDIYVDSDYWNISYYPSYMDLSYDINIPQGICVGWDEQGLSVCRYLSEHVNGLFCWDGLNGEPPFDPC